jgi:hypothetical protein
MIRTVVIISFVLLAILFTIASIRRRSKKVNALFIHIPKTGGNAIKKTSFFRDNCSYFFHEQMKNINWRLYDTSFAFVRNPYDRVVSAFFYLKNGGEKNNEDDAIMSKKLTKYNTFKDFVKDLYLFQEDIHFIPQYKFITDDIGNILVDHILRYEHMDTQYAQFVQEYTGHMPEVLKKVNTSKHDHFMNYYDRDTMNIVYSIYNKDFELFKYSPT